MDDLQGYALVAVQPRNQIEDNLCNDALLACPVGAIGDDGT